MSKIYKEPFSVEEQEFFKSKLYRYQEIKNWHIWFGATDKDGYGIIRPDFRKKKQLFTVHRLNYFLQNNCSFEIDGILSLFLMQIKGLLTFNSTFVPWRHDNVMWRHNMLKVNVVSIFQEISRYFLLFL